MTFHSEMLVFCYEIFGIEMVKHLDEKPSLEIFKSL